MATSNDALGTPQPPNRVYYSLGRMLGVEDFQADQDYHRGRLARALLQVCGTGTVAGLNVSVPQVWQANTPYAAFTFVFDASLNVQVNTGPAGTSGNASTFICRHCRKARSTTARTSSGPTGPHQRERLAAQLAIRFSGGHRRLQQ